MRLKIKIRLGIYFSLTAVLFLSVFLPELALIFFIIQNIDNFVIWIIIALFMPLLYSLSAITFGVIHAKLICKILPSIKPGKYLHGSDIAYLYSVAVVSPSIFKSMLKAFSFVPHLYSMLIGKSLGLYGLQTGENIYISSGAILDSHLVTIGSNSLIGLRAIISAHMTENEYLILAPVTIGNNVTIGGDSIVSPGASIGDNAIIGVNSVVKKNQIIPPNTIFAGSPAKLIQKTDAEDEYTIP